MSALQTFREEWDLDKKLLVYSIVCYVIAAFIGLAVWGYAVTFTMKPELAVFWTCGVAVFFVVAGSALLVCAAGVGEW